MNLDELKKMRFKQVVMTNGILLITFAIYFFIIKVFDITQTQLSLILGILIFLQAVIGFLTRNSTKSLIPIFEQVKVYEKKKMGIEWKKQRTSNYVLGFVLSGLMFVESYLNYGIEGTISNIDLSFIFIIVIFIVGLMNISLWRHIRKIDNSDAESLKGYTLKSNMVGLMLGLLFAFLMIIFTIIYFIY